MSNKLKSVYSDAAYGYTTTTCYIKISLFDDEECSS